MPKRTNDYRAGLLERLREREYAAEYLNAALEESDEAFLVALRDVAESEQIGKVAGSANLNREGLYRMLSEAGNPRLSSLSAVLAAVGLRLKIGTLDNA